jgi:hypothetical protein
VTPNVPGEIARYHFVYGDGFRHRLIPGFPGKKKPIVKWKAYQTSDPSPETIWGWDRSFPCPPYMRFLILGARTGLLVLDVDVRAKYERGIDAFDLLEQAPGYTPPRTFTVLTASGGWHFYYLYPNDLNVRNIIGGLWSATDIKAEGGYVVALDSVILGDPYLVAIDQPVAPLPDWLCTAIFAYQQRRAHPHRGGDNNGDKPGWQEALTAVSQGRQDDALIALAGKLTRTLPEELWPTIEATLAGTAATYPQREDDPYTDADFTRIAESAREMERARRAIDRPTVIRTVDL